MTACSGGSVLWLDEWFALDSAASVQASQWVLPASRWLRTQGRRFARVNLRLTVVGSASVNVQFQSSSNPEAASPTTLNGGGAAPSTWVQVGTTVSPVRSIVVDTQELNTENGLRDFLRIQATNASATDPAFLRVEAWVTVGD